MTLHQIQCHCCTWQMAFPSIETVWKEGWRVMATFRKGPPESPILLVVKWLCGTCASSPAYGQYVSDVGAVEGIETMFDQAPNAPENAFPAVGRTDALNRDRVKPYCGRCGGGDSKLDDDIVHKAPEELQ